MLQSWSVVNSLEKASPTRARTVPEQNTKRYLKGVETSTAGGVSKEEEIYRGLLEELRQFESELGGSNRARHDTKSTFWRHLVTNHLLGLQKRKLVSTTRSYCCLNFFCLLFLEAQIKL